MHFIISRHAGAVEWLASRIPAPYVHLLHLQSAQPIQAGDTVIGTLPVNLIAQINAQGATYLHLTLELPPHLRGQELTADQLDQLGAQLVRYEAQRHG